MNPESYSELTDLAGDTLTRHSALTIAMPRLSVCHRRGCRRIVKGKPTDRPCTCSPIMLYQSYPDIAETVQ
jgi:hypothetical protein